MQQASRTWHLEGNSICEGGGQPRQVGIQEQEIGSRERGGRKGRQALVRKVNHVKETGCYPKVSGLINERIGANSPGLACTPVGLC